MAQHYVPRYYLEHFAIDSDESQVFSMGKDFTIHDMPSPISNICAKKNYNTTEQETEQSQLERKHSEILREFVDTPSPDTYYRSPEFVESVSFLMGNNIRIRETFVNALRQMLLKSIESGFDGDISDIGIDLGYRGQLKSSQAFADCVFEEFQSWKFVRHGPTNGEKVYITSDNPVSIFNPESVFGTWETHIKLKDLKIRFDNESHPVSDGRMSKEVNFHFTFESVSFGQDVVMLFPITPSVCLLGFSDSTRHLKFINRAQSYNNDILAFMNLLTFSQCSKVVYSHCKRILESTKVDMPKFLKYCEDHGYPPSFNAGIA